MSYLILEDFRKGLDPRKLAIGAPAGTLTDFVNGHITNAGDIEKRKAFVEFADLAILDGAGNTGTFGLQETASGLTIFGSALPNGSLPSQNQAILAAAIPTINPPVTYQQLKHPAVLEGYTYDATKHRMTKLVSSELYGGAIQAVAEFTDGRRFEYSNGVFVEEFASGLVIEHLSGDATRFAAHMVRQINTSDGFTAAQTVLSVTQRARVGNVVTLTLSSNPITAGLTVGSQVSGSGIGGVGYNIVAAITALTSTTVSYISTTTATEGATASAGTLATALVTITGQTGEEFDVDFTSQSTAGTISGPTNTVAAVRAVEGAEAVGSFTITGGSANGVALAAATGTITSTSTNPSAGEFIQVGKKKYTFRATPTVEGDVKIGANAAASLVNLQRAINHSGTPGTDYVCAWAHPWARAGNISGLNLPLTAFKGSHGNSIALLASAATSLWTVSGANMTGGAGNCIGSVKVVAPDGTETELLSAAIQFTEDAATTAALVRDNIVSYAGTSGYTATVNQNTVTILSSDTADPMPNGYHIQVAGGGDSLIGECMFYLMQQQATFSINTILVDGLDCLASAEAFPTPPVDTLPEYYAELARVINTRSGITGINAWTNGEYVKLSRISTRNDDQPLTVNITPANSATVGIVFGEPPDLSIPLTVNLPTTLSTVGLTTNNGASNTMSVDLIADVKGGNGSYSFEWIDEYAGQSAGSLVMQAYIVSGGVNVPVPITQTGSYTIALSARNARGIRITFAATASYASSLGGYGLGYFDVAPTIVRYTLRCKVTDSFGNTATSGPCTVEFTNN